ncbi:signal recognition particle-docking protein FtsY [Mesorhizobium sp. YIM 152430]|uniref:signal recognition particle-docking protein FtsY n=1 Tax=Mesorhizobium sp. YIM 152430 TaxID=3031761 RepID=UPI0023DA922B|nr:signal recognition particle-docking protein FtsY [Mesorhizobium sp. YIM 152430]MDF1600621.1 signal recognition particle-docking protein FtsY [Mesorhizobium sp. YIM 152430]
MAGFFKKMFSFGRKDEAAEEAPREEIASRAAGPTVDAPALPDFLRQPRADEVEPAPAPLGPQPVPEVPIETPDQAPEPREFPEPEPVAPPAEVPVDPVPVEKPTPEPAPAEVPLPPAELPEPPTEIPPAPVETPPAPLPEIAPEPAPTPPPRAEAPAVPEFLKRKVEIEPDPSALVRVSRTVERGPASAPIAAPAAQRPWFDRLRDGLSRSSRELSTNISGVFTKRKLDEDTLQDLEDVLLRADLGMETAIRITDSLSEGRFGRDVSDAEVRAVMASEVEKVLAPVARPLELDLSVKPHVILVVGVNGTGKTTTIGKLAAKLVAGGLKVTLGAGDTFRAAAIEQLKIWGERTDSDVVASKLGADAAGLAWDAFEKAKANGSDVLIIDTAGRLQNKAELMAELEKVVRVLGKHDPEAPHTVLQTVDATTGQNAMNQVEIFRNVAGVNGIVMTKLDGTARGGILVAIAAKYRLPVYFIGVGEGVDDLEPFEARDFARAIAGVN